MDFTAGADAGLAGKEEAMKKTNFDGYLAEQMRDPAFAERFERAGEAWDVALQLAALRQQAGLSQQQLADMSQIPNDRRGEHRRGGPVGYHRR